MNVGVDPWGSRGDSRCIFFTLIHAEKFLLMTFDDTPTNFQNILWMHTQNMDEWAEGQADVEVKIVI